MKASLRFVSLAALTAATIALPVAAADMQGSPAKCAPKADMAKCGAKCAPKASKCAPKAAPKGDAMAKCAPGKCAPKTAPKN